MTQKRKTPTVHMSLSLEARDALNLAVLDIGSRMRKRLTQPTVLIAALEVAQKHPEELDTAISQILDKDETSTPNH